jgi:5-methylcytosine-specific restriction endonuclease McrA
VLSLTPIALDPKDTIESIIGWKRESRPTTIALKALLPRIKTRFDDYQAEREELSALGIDTWTDNESTVLKRCYTTWSDPLETLKANIRAAMPATFLNVCPYCGLGSGDTFDHYLHQDEFPEFSAHAWNLVPCCSTCNSKKGTVRLNNVGERVILNAYFDALPSAPMLTTAVTVSPHGNPVATFRLVQPAVVSTPLFRLIERHAGRLELLSRYKQTAPQVFTEVAYSVWHKRQRHSDAEIQTWLLEDADKYRGMFSINHWRVPLLRAMAGSTDFIAYCRRYVP